MKYRVISTDDHFVEPADLWQSRVPNRMKDAAPKVLMNDDSIMLAARLCCPLGYF